MTPQSIDPTQSNEFRVKTIAARITAEELGVVKAAARDSGSSCSEWLREAALASLQKTCPEPHYSDGCDHSRRGDCFAILASEPLCRGDSRISPSKCPTDYGTRRLGQVQRSTQGHATCEGRSGHEVTHWPRSLLVDLSRLLRIAGGTVTVRWNADEWRLVALRMRASPEPFPLRLTSTCQAARPARAHTRRLLSAEGL